MPGYPCCCRKVRNPNLCLANFTSEAYWEDDPYCVTSCSIKFTDASTPSIGETIVSRFWEFSDGGTSTQANPVYYFAGTGARWAKLTIIDSAGCTHSKTENFNVACNTTMCCGPYIPQVGVVLPPSFCGIGGTHVLNAICFGQPGNLIPTSGIGDGCYWCNSGSPAWICASLDPATGIPGVRISNDTASTLRNNYEKAGYVQPAWWTGHTSNVDDPQDCARMIAEYGGNLSFAGPGAAFRYCGTVGDPVSLILL